MERLLRENGVHIYLLDKDQPNDLYKLPKELHIGKEHTDKGQTGIILTPKKDVNKLSDVLKENKVDENLRKLCTNVFWYLAYNLGQDNLFVVAKYK